MLSEMFQNKQGFKLICGAGNEDTDEVEKIVYVYSKAGCRFFDICAKGDIIDAAKRGIKKAELNEKVYLCISVGAESDQHFCKALIDSIKCSSCALCQDTCPQNAINFYNKQFEINQLKCIGCKKCINVCPNNCISLVQKKTDYHQILPPLIEKGIDCIEFHVLGKEDDLFERWSIINDLFDGMLSISINRSVLGDEDLFNTIEKLVLKRMPYTTIIQADGIPMSGGKDDYNSTLQAIATADFFASKKLPVYVITSGGTNSKTSELAKMCGVNIDGVAIGSYARKIIKNYLSEKDFWQNGEIQDAAINIAKNLIDTTLKNLRTPLKNSIFYLE